MTAVVNVEQWNYVTRVEGLIKDASTRTIQALDDAYELAHQLEISEINTMFKMLVKAYLPDEEGHKFVMSDFNEHIVRFMEFKKEYTQSEKRRINVRSI